MSGTSETIRIDGWREIANRDSLMPGLDEVFFTSSATQSFSSAEARAQFRERWLGRFLIHYPDWAFVAREPGGRVAAYIVGSPDDPALTPLFADVGYFPAIAHLTRRFPAGLHVNVRADLRSAGLGARLIEAFAAKAKRAGLAGLHAVTGEGLRNTGFYRRNGFTFEEPFTWNNRALVFLGRAIEL